MLVHKPHPQMPQGGRREQTVESCSQTFIADTDTYMICTQYIYIYTIKDYTQHGEGSITRILMAGSHTWAMFWNLSWGAALVYVTLNSWISRFLWICQVLVLLT